MCWQPWILWGNVLSGSDILAPSHIHTSVQFKALLMHACHALAKYILLVLAGYNHFIPAIHHVDYSDNEARNQISSPDTICVMSYCLQYSFPFIFSSMDWKERQKYLLNFHDLELLFIKSSLWWYSYIFCCIIYPQIV